MPKNEDPVAEFKRRAEEIGWGWSLSCHYMSTKPYRAVIYSTDVMTCLGDGHTEAEACQSALDRLGAAYSGRGSGSYGQ